jgi:magnesium-dependent phosphatase 1
MFLFLSSGFFLQIILLFTTSIFGVQISFLTGSALATKTKLPRLVVFDLDGCLWKPELHDLSRYSFSQEMAFELMNKNRCRSNTGSIIALFPDVTWIIEHVLSLENGPKLAIASRTSHPDWALELLQTFQLPSTGNSLMEVMNGPCIMNSSISKVKQFMQIEKETKIPCTEMLFFDNDIGNCKSVSRLGVTVGYCPNGIERGIFEKSMVKFPVKWGVVGLQVM